MFLNNCNLRFVYFDLTITYPIDDRCSLFIYRYTQCTQKQANLDNTMMMLMLLWGDFTQIYNTKFMNNWYWWNDTHRHWTLLIIVVDIFYIILYINISDMFLMDNDDGQTVDIIWLCFVDIHNDNDVSSTVYRFCSVQLNWK